MEYSTSPEHEERVTKLLARKGDDILRSYPDNKGYTISFLALIQIGAGAVVDATHCISEEGSGAEAITDEEYKAVMEVVNTKLGEINTELKALEKRLNKKDVLLPIKMINIKPMLLLGKERHTVIEYKETKE